MIKTVATIRALILLLSLTLPGSVFGTDITFTMTGASPYCGGSTATVNYTGPPSTFTAGNIFNVELSDATGSFTSPVVIGSLSSTADTGSIPVTFPPTASGTAFRIRITSSNPALTGSDNGTDLTINPQTSVSVTINMSPNGPLCSTHNATFTATPAGGGTSPTYQWKKNGADVGIPSSSYPDGSLNDGDEVYALLTSNATCPAPTQAESNHIIVTQRDIVAPAVTISGPLIVCQGFDAQFTATPANGGTSPSYQWMKDGINVGTDSYVYVDNTLTDGNVISCVMTSNRECVSSPTADSNDLDIDVSSTVTPTIDIHADPTGTIGVGSVVYISSTITNGGAAPAYEWKQDGVVVGNSNSLVLYNVSANTIVTAKLTSNADCAQPAIIDSNTINIAVDPDMTKSNHAWEARAPHVDARSNASGFSIGGKAYIGVGFVMAGATLTYRKDFWEYDPATDSWTQKADFGGVGRYNAVGFSVGNKGFIGTGISATGVRKDFWQYDVTTNSWIQRLDIPGAAREQAFAFAIGNRGYIGGGYSSGFGDFQDFYEFDPSSNSWTARADFAGGKRSGGAGFAINTKGFVAGGYSSSTDTWYKDFWDFDQAGNVWTQRTDLPGNPRTRATAFALAGYGYVGLGNSESGYDGQFFQYAVPTDTWITRPFFSGPSTTNFGTGIATNIGNRAFVFKDGTWTEYDLFTTTSFSSRICTTETIPVAFNASGFAFGTNNIFTAQMSPSPGFSVTTTLGTSVSSASAGTVNAVIPTSASGGTYYFRITSSNPPLTTLLETINITGLPSSNSISAQNGATVCVGVPITFTSQLDAPGIQWLKNNIVVGTDYKTYTDSGLATGDVIKAVKSYNTGCTATVGVPSNVIVMTVHNPAKPTVNVSQPNILLSSPAIAYQWYENGTAIARANAEVYEMTEDGVYKVRTTDSGGCFAFSDDINNAFTGFEDDVFASDVNTYPSPFANDMFLALADHIVIQGCEYSLLNELGQTIVNNQKGEKINRIDLSGRAPGMYLVKVKFGESTVVRRVIKF
jgi:N-acetylneuraminic acid mutarotase